MTDSQLSGAVHAVVLAGGRSSRMAGIDKTRAVVGGRTLLERVLDAVPPSVPVTVVGPQTEVRRPVVWLRENPPGSGPAAAVAAALPSVRADVVVLLAADLPFLSAAQVRSLVANVEADGAVVVDDDGREQWLCSAWRADVLRVASLGPGRSLRHALMPLRFATVPALEPALPCWLDCDTPDDLRRAREMA